LRRARGNEADGRHTREEDEMAATDPVEQIQVQRHETELVGNLGERLARLAALPPSVEVPYLTVYLDWRPDGAAPGRRPARRQFADEVEGLLARHAAHSPARESLEADVARVRTYLDEVPSAAQGVAIVARQAGGVFEPLPLGLPVPTRVVEWPTPALAELVRQAEDYPRFVVVQIDQREALISVVDQARRSASVEIEGSNYPRHQQQGGWSQKRYQRRAEERIEAFARAAADLTRVALEAGKIETLIVLGDDVIVPALKEAFHQTVAAKLAGVLPSTMEATFQELMDLTLPVVEQAARARELEAVRAVQEAAGAEGPGAAGAEDVLTALQTGQVQILVMNDDFVAPGWADYSFPLYGVGAPPSAHPAGGDPANIVGVSLADELVRLALQSDAAVEVVRTAVPVSADDQADVPEARGDEPMPRTEAARRLDELGGVGVVLRFALAEDQPTADL
jgi:hypothetical protein